MRQDNEEQAGLPAAPATPESENDPCNPNVRPSTVDERAHDYKARLTQHLEAIAAIMNQALSDNIAVSFNVNRGEDGVYAPANVIVLRTY